MGGEARCILEEDEELIEALIHENWRKTLILVNTWVEEQISCKFW